MTEICCHIILQFSLKFASLDYSISVLVEIHCMSSLWTILDAFTFPLDYFLSACYLHAHWHLQTFFVMTLVIFIPQYFSQPIPQIHKVCLVSHALCLLGC